MSKFKTYHGSVFSHKKAIWGGLDQSKGMTHEGNYVEMMLNLNDDDNVLSQRTGQVVKISGISPVYSGKLTLSGLSIAAGTSLFFDEVFPDLIGA